MVVDQPIGVGLSREISEEEYRRGERGEADIDLFIDRRSRREERLKREAEAWAESARIYHRERQRVLAIEWREFHYLMADRCRNNLLDMITYHEREAEKYDRLIPDTEQKGA
jgi:hypothetical protein